MLKRIILLLLSVLLPFFTFSISKGKKTDFPEKVLFIVNFDEKTKINEKYMKVYEEILPGNKEEIQNNVETDVSSDTALEEKLPEQQENIDNSKENSSIQKKEIYLSDEQTLFFQDVLNKNKSDLEMKLFKIVKSKNVKTAFFRNMENTENIPEIHVYIENYQSGEFNLIKNINTQMTYSAEVISRDKKNIAKIRKKYIVKTVSSKPLEAQRLSEVNERFAKELFRLMTKYLQDKTE